ncbi:DUF192 domain-containing protein [Candidatus Kaiserbacteria bacterium]|nr:DUF192 domain-containing protein [Candidatus Kaiserbacteria bacterium]
MIQSLFRNSETRRILIYLGAAGVCALIGGSIYAAAMNAVTPSSLYRDVRNVVSSTLSPTKTISIAGTSVRVAIADTPAKREQGLSGQAGLGENEGMLFIFPADGIFSFWMKDMLFSIDILWITADGKVVYMAQNAKPESYPASFMPDLAARYVLELPAGWAKAHNVSIGDQVAL